MAEKIELAKSEYVGHRYKSGDFIKTLDGRIMYIEFVTQWGNPPPDYSVHLISWEPKHRHMPPRDFIQHEEIDHNAELTEEDWRRCINCLDYKSGVYTPPHNDSNR